jgi:hypothetical protein
LLNNLKPLIDDAIEKAGGTGWRDYLSTFEQGMQQVNQQKLGAKLLGMYQKNPKGYVDLISGNDPKAIEKIFGRGSYDVIAEMGDKYVPLRQVGDYLANEKQIGEMAKTGAVAGTHLLNKPGFRLPGFLNPKITITNSLLSDLHAHVNTKTLAILVKASRSGQSMNEVLQVLPAKERDNILSYMLTNGPRISGAITTAGAAAGATQ